MSTYLVTYLVAWPVLTFAFAGRLNHLRRGPSFGSVAVLAAVCAVVWPLALVVLFVAPRPRSRS
ncbi:hypothetical protein ACFPK1_18860 [Actinomycetospora rhizophila]|uniref:Uncharacterized protein n=1 Tax=Actinomycetospora rhizophila TaxID=1416876 RepID=A0ABV9ZJI5_9PSEU